MVKNCSKWISVNKAETKPTRPNISRRGKIIKIRVEINEIETKRDKKKKKGSMKVKTNSLKS